MRKFASQFAHHIVALISLVVAVVALFYTSWRLESSERNITARFAGFEMLKNLGELQVIVNRVRYEKDDTLGNPYLGWGRVAFIGDLSELLPHPVSENAKALISAWGENWKEIKDDDRASGAISEEIDNCRQAVLKAIQELK